MDVPAGVLQSLKCSRCEAYLSRGPVYLQHDRAAVCGRCFAPERPATRMNQYEAVAKLVRFPCRNQNLGCPVTVPFVDEGEEIGHDEVCEYRQYVCPVVDSVRCDWLGTRAGILQHCSSQHPDLVLQNPTALRHDITRASTHTYLLTAFHVLFILYTQVCLMSGRIYYFVRPLGTSEDAAKYDYVLDIQRGKDCLSKTGVVPPQGCLEPTLLALNTNSLLDVLGGFDGTTFTLTVKQLVSNATKELTTAVTCATCGAVELGPLYCKKDGWRCERCDPARHTCKNRGCTYTDIEEKCEKHEWYFCQQRTKCYICFKTLLGDSLSEHYESAHKAQTCLAGSMWRVTRSGWRRCLLSSVAGIAMCGYGLYKSSFVLCVRIPVSSERLSEFHCTIRLTHRNTGRTHTYTPDACHTDINDWHIVVKSEEFPSWRGEFVVGVDIARAGSV